MSSDGIRTSLWVFFVARLRTEQMNTSDDQQGQSDIDEPASRSGVRFGDRNYYRGVPL